MKLIGVMSLAGDRDGVRKIFEKHEVQIFSEAEIAGHTASTLEQYGWWPTVRDAPAYSVLFFSIVLEEKAAEIMDEIEEFKRGSTSDHPLRAFQVNVERML